MQQSHIFIFNKLSLNYIYIDFYLSIKISIINIETMSIETKTISESPDLSDASIELQLGDIIHISNNVNEQLNDKTFMFKTNKKT